MEEAMANETNILAAIKNTYDQLDDKFYALYAKCENDDQRQQLKSLLASARDAFFAAAAKSLTDNNPTVIALTKQLQSANGELTNQLADIKDVVSALALGTEALKLAASLAVLAAAA
jgi:hypothetical protein